MTRRRPPRGEDLAEFLDRHRRARAAQGLPPTVEDEAVLDQVAEILRAAAERQTPRRRRQAEFGYEKRP